MIARILTHILEVHESTSSRGLCPLLLFLNLAFDIATCVSRHLTQEVWFWPFLNRSGMSSSHLDVLVWMIRRLILFNYGPELSQPLSLLNYLLFFSFFNSIRVLNRFFLIIFSELSLIFLIYFTFLKSDTSLLVNMLALIDELLFF